ncbi:type IX secretion system motor protein PorM/GldM [Larkinella soli]|uniref:type IX secretion system motor protein PorM/GldM n=1 Tax=Larkinella soli TaxID=1770527 RepID=UPI000FFC4B97|nr:gliding motility protein GldM [Larkinella soli]
MAGAKETPRQKMIGMMYLVLTAMLALQVSSALLEKFILLNSSLETSTGSANRINQATFESIKTTVEKSGNRAADLAVVKQAEEVRTLTSSIITELDAVKQQLINEAGGGVDEQGNIKNPSEEDKVGILMIGGKKNGKAYDLQQKMNRYVEQLSRYSTAKYTPLAVDAKDDPIASRSKEQQNKDFAELNFEQTPVPAALAVLSQKQSEIRRMEGEVLDNLASKVGAQDIKFDKILAMLSMESKVVVAGTKFKGEMFLAASSSGITPRMSLNGAPVRVDGGRGVIEFTAQGGAYDKNGLAKRALTGAISFKTPSGRDTTVRFSQEYFVAKPSYEIETATLPPLYLGCANKLSIQSPQLGALWNPSFSANGAAVLTSGERGKITIVPSSASVSLNVSNAGSVLGTENFRVNRVPRPTLKVFAGGAEIDERRGMPISSVRNVQVRAIPDESFKNFMPEDAKFRVSGFTVSLAQGSRRIAGPVTLGPNGGNIGSLVSEAQPGMRYVIEVDGVQRQNFRGEVSDVPVTQKYFTIPLY